MQPSSGSDNHVQKEFMDIDHVPKDKKTVDCSLDVDHEPNDKKTVDSSLDVDHDKEVCDIEWYLYYR